jgi:ATP-dependent Lon protease
MRRIFSVLMFGAFMLIVVQSLYAGPSEQHIRARIAELQHRIDEGVRAGSLTPTENRNLQSRLDRIREHFDKAEEKRYGLSDQEVASFNKQLDALGKDVDREKHDLQTTRIDDQIIHRINEMQKRIETGNRDGSLTGSEAKSLQARLDGIRSHYDRAQRGGLSQEEIRAIEHKLDALGKDIYKEKHDSQRAR